ncbi:MAG: DUF4178 domain-containing protein, partial [Bacteroidota bacterium]
PNCGGQVEIHPDRGPKSVVCTHCGSVIDLTGRQLDIIGRVKTKFKPLKDIHPGAEATFDGERHLVTGWLRYKGWDSEESWTWDEWQLVSDGGVIRYLSWSPDEGFLLQTPLHPSPKVTRAGIELPEGRTPFREISPAAIKQMAGELTWRPRLDETLRVGEARRGSMQYSAELTADEIEVVGGQKLPEIAVWEAFGREDILAEMREREERAKRRRQRAARTARLLTLIALGLLAFTIWGVPRMGGTVLDVSVTYTSPPVSTEAQAEARLRAIEPDESLWSPTARQAARRLAETDTVEIGTVRLDRDNAYTARVATTSPVESPLAVGLDLVFVNPSLAKDPDARSSWSPAFASLSGPVGSAVSDESSAFQISSRGVGGATDYRLVAVVTQGWVDVLGDHDRDWTEDVSFPISVTVQRAWTRGPLGFAVAFFLFLAFCFFAFSRTGPR